MYQPYIHNTYEKYVNYYTTQAGGDLAGYSGLGSQYGVGLSVVYRGLFRLAFLLLKKGIMVATSRLKTAT